MADVRQKLDDCQADIIGISAGFDNHRQDLGGLLSTDDYKTMGRWVLETARKNSGGCFAILESGYNQQMLGQNVKALMEGLSLKN